MTKLHKLLATALLAGMAGAAHAQVPIVPLDVPTIQAQSNAIIQQQNLGTQLNNLQLQQNLTQDRIREQQLFTPQPGFGVAPYGAPIYGAPYFLPQPAPVPVPRPRP